MDYIMRAYLTHLLPVFSAVLTCPGVARSQPGAVLPGAQVLERPGDVGAASVDDAGRVTLAGVFSKVDGQPVPGVTRLLPDGSVDPDFHAGAGLTEGPTEMPGLVTGIPSLRMCPTLVSWPGGELLGDPSMEMEWPGGTLVRDEPLQGGLSLVSWAVLDPVGDVLPGALPAIPSSAPLVPQFVTGGKMTALVTLPDAATGFLRRTLRRLDLATGLDDPAFLPANSAAEPLQAIPAADGGTWVLERPVSSISSRLRKLDASGRQAAGHTPRSIFGTGVRLMETGGGAFVVSTAQRSLQLGGINTYVLESRTAMDAPVLTLSVPGVPPFLPEPGGSVIMQQPSGDIGEPASVAAGLWRWQTDGTRDGGFHRAQAVRTLDRLADGRILADGQRRYLPDGSADPSWSVPALLDAGKVRLLRSGPGGRVYGAGEFTLVDGQPRPGLACWRADGTLDTDFAPAVVQENTAPVVDMAPLPDGRVLVLRRSGSHSTLERLWPHRGQTDPGFQPRLPENAGWTMADVQRLAVQPDGSVLAVAVWQGPSTFDCCAWACDCFNIFINVSQNNILMPSFSTATRRTVLRLALDGGVTVLPVPESSTDTAILAAGGGRFFMDGRRFLPNGNVDPAWTPGAWSAGVPLCPLGNGWLWPDQQGNVQLVRADGTVDPSFTVRLPAGVGALCSGPGRALYSAPPQGAAGPAEIIRSWADGRRDPSFRGPSLERRNESIPADLPLIGNGRNGFPSSPVAMLVHPLTGQLWAAGEFTRAGSAVRSGLVLLDASVPAGFDAWSAAAVGSGTTAAPDADPDADGVANFREYAAGTDPLLADAADSALVILNTDPLCVAAPRNTSAPEVVTVLEVSEDLRTWRTATAAEAVRKTVDSRETFALAPAAGRRYCRVRYRTL